MLIILFLVLHFNFLFVPCGRLSWLPVSFLLHVKHTLSYRIGRPRTMLLDWLLKTEEGNISYEELKMSAQDRSRWSQ